MTKQSSQSTGSASAVIGFNYSVRELQGTRYGPIIGTYLAASDRPPDEGSLIEVDGKFRRVIVAGRRHELDELNNTILVESYPDPA